MYLPHEIRNAQILIAVKTYPLPSNKYNELVCTAGFLPNGKWIRLYPIPFRALPYDEQYQKYHWITLSIIRNTKDFRPESYRSLIGSEDIQLGERLGTENNWEKRKEYALTEVFTSMNELIQRAKSEERKSLATLKPREIVDFIIEPTEREWKPQWRDHLLQFNLFDLNAQGEGKARQVLPKLPYKYFYRFLTEGDQRPRTIMIEDWELGALFWKMYYKYGRDEDHANRLVKQKFFDEFCNKKDLYFFVGTTQQYHLIARNPFVIIGVFYPLKLTSPSATKKSKAALHENGNISQLPLFDL